MPTKPSVPALPSQSTARLRQRDNSRVAQYNPALRSLFEAGGEIKINARGRGRGGEQMVKLLNPGALKAFKEYEDEVTTGSIEDAFLLTFPTQKGDFTFSEICKPKTKANMGDVAEGVFAAAIGARFIQNRDITKNVGPSDVQKIILLMSRSGTTKISGKKGMEVRITEKAPNYPERSGIPDDEVEVYVTLSEGNMKFFLDKGNISAMSGLITSACKFANEPNVKAWANTIYTNEKKDYILVHAIGLTAQKTSKIDVMVEIADERGVLQRIPGLQVSVKAGDVAQFGQKAGTNWSYRKKKGRMPAAEGYDWFFKKLFNVDINKDISWTEDGDKGYNAVKATNENLAIKKLWTLVSDAAEKKMNAKPKEFFENLGNAIQFFARSTDDMVTLVQLKSNDAQTYKFSGLPEMLAKDVWNWKIKYSEGKSKDKPPRVLPKIEIIETGKPSRGNDENATELEKAIGAGAGGQLIQIRVKAENKSNGTKYIRNYVEKGDFMTKLISHKTQGLIGN